jgi:hypothetical protein
VRVKKRVLISIVVYMLIVCFVFRGAARRAPPGSRLIIFSSSFSLACKGRSWGAGWAFYATYWTLSLVQPCPPTQPERRACELGTSLISLIVGAQSGDSSRSDVFWEWRSPERSSGVQGNVFLAFAGEHRRHYRRNSGRRANWVLEPTDLSLVVNPVTMAALGATLGYNIGATIAPPSRVPP